MHLSTLPSSLGKPLAFSLLAAAMVLTAHAETHVNIDLGLRLGPPPPVIVRQAPPRPVIVERQYNAPGPGFVWVAGHNMWINDRWAWIPGTWARPPQNNTIYVEGRWDERSRNWIAPHWEIVGPPPPPAPIVIVQAPPRPRYEHPGRRPSRDVVWVDGYWAWRGRRYEWVSGRWDRPPHGHGRWNAPRYERRGNSYVFIEGSWR